MGRTFRLDAEPEAIDMTLTEAAAVGAPPADGSMRQAFSLVFTGPPGCVLPQQTYQLIHQEMGELDIFLVPIGSDEEGTQYEAIFN
ncbi:hypothetical protein HQ560_21130 [bacterium]|nr:hypothetical protein [bacterium]